MSHPVSLSTLEIVAALCQSLEPFHQSSLLDFACFLKSQGATAAFDVVDEEDEAEWESHFNDLVKVANFARWADESRAADKPQPIDLSRL